MVQLNLPALRSFLWGPKVNQALEDLNEAKLEADSLPAAVNPVVDARIDEIVAAPNDTVVALLVDDEASATRAALDGSYASAAISKADIGLGNVNNTSDVEKPVSAAQQTALDAKAPTANPTFTGTVSGVTKAHVGLGNVDNTSDANKPGFPKGKTGQKYQLLACTIRRVDATTWEALNDASHAPTGVTSVSIVSSNRVRITYNFTAVKVVTFSATLDEAFTASTALVRCGASVGTTFADVYFHTSSSGSTPVDPGTLSTAGANVWIYGLFEVA